MNSVTPVGESRCSPGLTYGTSSLCVSAFKVSPAWVEEEVPHMAHN